MKHPKRMTDDELEDALIECLDEIYLRQSQFISITADSGAKPVVMMPFSGKNVEVVQGIPTAPPELPDKKQIKERIFKLNKQSRERINDVLIDYDIAVKKILATFCLFVGIAMIVGGSWHG